ncbi:hypothetical protein CC2G_002089 [Coprinopsis cinerea AmutBmut pab1-1]|nr:hypothetical protein CC2G_002089 [Coprinopsis cinerea AmutBmut pab1-1]
MARGSGKFKHKRGGGRNFSKNLMHVDPNAESFGDRSAYRSRRAQDDDDDDSEEDSEEESEDGSEEGSSEEEEEEDQPQLTRAERKELKKKQALEKAKGKTKATGSGDDDDEDEDDSDLINPNHVQKKMTISDLNAPRELSRREREQKEKQEAKDRYWKLHVQGKTAEAKADLARLAKIRAEREAAQAKRKAEEEARKAEIEAKRQAQLEKLKKKI